MKRYAWSIAGWDPSGHAGTLADLEAFHHLGVNGVAILATLTAQNATQVLAVHPLKAAWIRAQAEALLPQYPPAAIKIGLLGSTAAIREVSRLLDHFPQVPVVLDPVLRSTSGALLLDPRAVRPLAKLLFMRATVLTPNIPEAQVLLGRRIQTRKEMVRAACDLRLGWGSTAVVLKGGHRRGQPLDILNSAEGTWVFTGNRVHGSQARGTGCRFASAIAASLARGMSLPQAVRLAKSYLLRVIRQGSRRA